jgi:quercetin dioxygenase-like cupin family protein
MKRLAVLATVGAAAVAAIATAATALPSGAAAPRQAEQAHGVHITPLSAGTIGSRVHAHSAGIEIETHGPRDMLVTSIVVDPGGSFGWHTHPGPVLVAVSKGTLTFYEPQGARCSRSTVTAGQAFIEDGRDVHLARNEGSDPIELNAIFLARTGTTEFLTPVPEPRGCHV